MRLDGFAWAFPGNLSHDFLGRWDNLWECDYILRNTAVQHPGSQPHAVQTTPHKSGSSNQIR